MYKGENKKMKTKYMYSLILIGLLLLPISTLVDGKTYYEEHGMEYGNKYNACSMFTRSKELNQATFGICFHSTSTKQINKIGLYFSNTLATSVNNPWLKICGMNTTTGLPDMVFLGGINISFYWSIGWNLVNLGTNLQLQNNTYYYVMIHEYKNQYPRGTAVKVPLIDQNTNAFFSRGYNGSYEPLECYYEFRGADVTGGLYKFGYMPWYICNSSDVSHTLEGNVYDLFNTQGTSISSTYVNCQYFISDKNINCTSLTVPFAMISPNNWKMGDNIYYSIKNESTGIVINSGIIVNKSETCVSRSTNDLNYVGRPYTVWFNSPVYLKKNVLYNMSFTSPLSTAQNGMSICLVSTSNSSLSAYTFNGITGFYRVKHYFTGVWTNHTNYDIPFYFTYINESFLDKTMCGNTSFSHIENLTNVNYSISYLYNFNTGWHYWINGTGNTSIPGICPSTNLTIYENLLNCTGNHTEYYNSTNGYIQYLNYTGNCSSNCTIDTNRYFDLMGVLTFDNTQFFLAILIGLWCFFIVEYYNHKELLFAYVQLLFAFPLTLYLAGITFFMAQYIILPIVFIIPILAIYIVADGLYYRRNKTKK
jgi:hypothetical protein